MVKLFLSGFGTVGQGLVDVLGRRRDFFEERYGEQPIIVGVMDSRSFAVDPKGLDMEAIVAVLEQAKALRNGKPVMILFHTEMGHGVDFMAGTHKWHGKAPSAEQCAVALQQLEETLGDF